MNGNGEACRRMMTRDDDEYCMCNDKLVAVTVPMNYIIVIIVNIVLH